MLRWATLLVTGLATAASAMPGSHLFERAACNRDNCLRQVVASNAAPGPAQGSADCSAFMTAVVTPCPVTATVVASPATMTTTTSTTVSSLTTSTSTSDIVIPTTTTSYYTVTKTSYPPGPGKKRAVEVEDHLEKRATTAAACSPTISTGTVPIYASSCSGTVRYSSACSCNGITATIKTLFPKTTTVTSTPTTTVTTTITFTATQTTEYDVINIILTTTTVASPTATVTVAADQYSCPSYIDQKIGCSDGSTCNSHPNCFQNIGGDYNTCYSACEATNCFSPYYFNQADACALYYDCCRAPVVGQYFQGF